ncbi:MAG: ubiquinol-cytochrome c chaperone [Proteobacteria bacterium]|nr:ubiquinol-cytochrome c chaperone [Pseudomonadota bacterium]
MPAWPFSPSLADKDAARLLLQVTNASRNPALFGEGRVADTLDGRFEVVTMHAALALIRLRGAPDAAALSQGFVDALFRHLDAGLREDGVGDLTVPKRMRKLATITYGRVDAYAAALADGSDALQGVLTRNVLNGEPTFAPQLARHVCDLADLQSLLDWQALLTADAWPAFVA